MAEEKDPRLVQLKARIDSYKTKIADFEKEYSSNDPEDIYGRHDRVENMKKNVARLDEYFAQLEGKSGAEAIRITNTMEAYFISLDITAHKLPLNILQKDPKGA